MRHRGLDVVAHAAEGANSPSMSVADLVQAQLDQFWDGRPGPFDVHAHTGTDIDGTVRTSDQHLADLAAVQGRSVIFPLCAATGYEAENARVIAEAVAHAELVAFARLDPRVDGRREAMRDLAAGASGFKLHPRAESFRLEHPNVDAILAVAADAAVPVLIHAGRGVGSFGPVLVELARRHRSCSIILAHAGISDLAWLTRVADQHPNLFFDTAWWNPTDLVALFSLVPPGQILHGSDAPYGDVAGNLLITIRCGLAAGLSHEQLEFVAGAQLERLLAGDVPAPLGRPVNPPLPTPRPDRARAAVFLAGAGGCLLGGGDPHEMIELALLSLEPSNGVGESAEDEVLRELICGIDWGRPTEVAVSLGVALTVAVTDRVADRSFAQARALRAQRQHGVKSSAGPDVAGPGGS
jgi:predicted TIM-barrel fold metal-dependent hydrolase